MKQCKEYYKALEKGNYLGAHYLYIPEPRLPLFIQEQKERSEENWRKYKAEEEYLKNLPKELYQFEVEYQINKRCQNNACQEKGRNCSRKKSRNLPIFILTILLSYLIAIILIKVM